MALYMPCMFEKKYSAIDILKYFIFPEKQALTVLANCLLRSQFCNKCQNLFSGENKKNLVNLSSVEIA